MIKIFRLLCVAILLTFFVDGDAQGYNIGIRAGLGRGQFQGPVEQGESYGFAGGFHFGLSFQWNFNDVIGWRSEILYNQTGSSYSFDSPEGYYVFTPEDFSSNVIIRDTSSIRLKHSNAYLQFPQTFHFSVTDKIELFAGGYIGFLINPVATGSITFGGSSRTQEHSFQQGLNFNYFGDDANTRGDFLTQTGQNILIRANGKDVTLKGIENSYNFNSFNIDDGRFLSIDYGLITGVSYYFNRGLYIMGRVEYGMRDITRNTGDYSLVNVNSDETPIFNNDNDKNLGIYMSVGFRF